MGKKKAKIPSIKELVFIGNPLEEKHTAEGNWRTKVISKLENLEKLDGNKPDYLIFFNMNSVKICISILKVILLSIRKLKNKIRITKNFK